MNGIHLLPKVLKNWCISDNYDLVTLSLTYPETCLHSTTESDLFIWKFTYPHSLYGNWLRYPDKWGFIVYIYLPIICMKYNVFWNYYCKFNFNGGGGFTLKNSCFYICCYTPATKLLVLLVTNKAILMLRPFTNPTTVNGSIIVLVFPNFNAISFVFIETSIKFAHIKHTPSPPFKLNTCSLRLNVTVSSRYFLLRFFC